MAARHVDERTNLSAEHNAAIVKALEFLDNHPRLTPVYNAIGTYVPANDDADALNQAMGLTEVREDILLAIIVEARKPQEPDAAAANTPLPRRREYEFARSGQVVIFPSI